MNRQDEVMSLNEASPGLTKWGIAFAVAGLLSLAALPQPAQAALVSHAVIPAQAGIDNDATDSVGANNGTVSGEAYLLVRGYSE